MEREQQNIPCQQKEGHLHRLSLLHTDKEYGLNAVQTKPTSFLLLPPVAKCITSEGWRQKKKELSEREMTHSEEMEDAFRKA